jgi:hypothetical protein
VSIIWIVTIVTGMYVALAGFLFVFQSNYVYYPERTLKSAPGNIGLSFENVSFETTDGVKLSSWFVPCEGARGIILFCYGNAGNMSYRLDSIQIFHRLGLGVFDLPPLLIPLVKSQSQLEQIALSRPWLLQES